MAKLNWVSNTRNRIASKEIGSHPKIFDRKKFLREMDHQAAMFEKAREQTIVDNQQRAIKDLVAKRRQTIGIMDIAEGKARVLDPEEVKARLLARR